MAIYRHEPDEAGPEHFTIASHNVWLPGNYDSESTARYAFRFNDSVLNRLQESVNWEQHRPITKTDLRDALSGVTA